MNPTTTTDNNTMKSTISTRPELQLFIDGHLHKPVRGRTGRASGSGKCRYHLDDVYTSRITQIDDIEARSDIDVLERILDEALNEQFPNGVIEPFLVDGIDFDVVVYSSCQEFVDLQSSKPPIEPTDDDGFRMLVSDVAEVSYRFMEPEKIRKYMEMPRQWIQQAEYY